MIGGWVKSGRTAEKNSFAFLEINDGSSPKHIQCLVSKDIVDPDRCRQTVRLPFQCERGLLASWIVDPFPPLPPSLRPSLNPD